jgi:uncharacterized protein (DUF2062 family)
MGSASSSKNRRLRLTKKILRHLPRKSQLERLPFVGRLIGGAHRANFLWSLQRQAVMAALLIGWVVALSPFFGIHTLLVVICALLCRANVLIALALQLVSTPLTIPFLWPMLHFIGKWAVNSLAGPQATMANGNFFHSAALLALGGLLSAYICTAISIIVYLLLFHPPKRRERNRDESEE